MGHATITETAAVTSWSDQRSASEGVEGPVLEFADVAEGVEESCLAYIVAGGNGYVECG